MDRVEVTKDYLVLLTLPMRFFLVDNFMRFICFAFITLMLPSGAMTESVEREPRVWEIGSSVSHRFKPMNYKVDTCHFLAWCSALIA